MTGEQHEDLELRQGQVRREERILPVLGDQILQLLLGAHNVRDELFLAGYRRPLLCRAPMACPRRRPTTPPTGQTGRGAAFHDGRYQRTPAENHLFVSGKLLMLDEPLPGERTCHS
ncbi:hypothetical protein Abr02nite_05370 [Paractinoplanes brasiliensis]|nr:hypothetical protein Abr02nite_05370 [Actinoplanes brasiliensis]